MLRTGAQIERIAAAHPDDGVIESKYLHVVFFDRAPVGDPAVDSTRFEPDRFVVEDREAFVTHPEGSGRSKLTVDVLERAFGVSATARNMNTVRRLSVFVGG